MLVLPLVPDFLWLPLLLTAAPLLQPTSWVIPATTAGCLGHVHHKWWCPDRGKMIFPSCSCYGFGFWLKFLLVVLFYMLIAVLSHSPEFVLEDFSCEFMGIHLILTRVMYIAPSCSCCKVYTSAASSFSIHPSDKELCLKNLFQRRLLVNILTKIYLWF